MTEQYGDDWNLAENLNLMTLNAIDYRLTILIILTIRNFKQTWFFVNILTFQECDEDRETLGQGTTSPGNNSPRQAESTDSNPSSSSSEIALASDDEEADSGRFSDSGFAGDGKRSPAESFPFTGKDTPPETVRTEVFPGRISVSVRGLEGDATKRPSYRDVVRSTPTRSSGRRTQNVKSHSCSDIVSKSDKSSGRQQVDASSWPDRFPSVHVFLVDFPRLPRCLTRRRQKKEFHFPCTYKSDTLVFTSSSASFSEVGGVDRASVCSSPSNENLFFWATLFVRPLCCPLIGRCRVVLWRRWRWWWRWWWWCVKNYDGSVYWEYFAWWKFLMYLPGS